VSDVSVINLWSEELLGVLKHEGLRKGLHDLRVLLSHGYANLGQDGGSRVPKTMKVHVRASLSLYVDLVTIEITIRQVIIDNVGGVKRLVDVTDEVEEETNVEAILKRQVGWLSPTLVFIDDSLDIVD
jgi:hypothetical protein